MKVGIVYPRANVDTVPSLVGAAEMFAQVGYDVDLFTYTRAGQPAPAFGSPRIRQRSLGLDGFAEHSPAGLRSLAKRAAWLAAPVRAPLTRGYHVLGTGLAHGSRIVAHARNAYDASEPFACVIGVDPDGLTLAHRLARGAPLGYYSLELLLSNELRTGADVKPEARVVIHSGSLGDWTGIEQIVEAVAEWPRAWVLVIHTRYDAESSSYVENLRKRADARRVWFSLKPVPRQDYDALIDGADVGVAFYVPTGASSFTGSNVRTIGLSSGKLAYYLRAGLPVVVNRAASISSSIESSGAGVAVEDARGVGDALQRVSADHEAMSGRACAFFEEQLDFRRAFAEVVRRVE